MHVYALCSNWLGFSFLCQVWNGTSSVIGDKVVTALIKSQVGAVA